MSAGSGSVAPPSCHDRMAVIMVATAAAATISSRAEGDPAALARARGFRAMDAAAAEALVDRLIADHPEEWKRYAGGEAKLAGFFVGRAMKATGGQADGRAVTALLQRRAAP